jgi:small subunit ribosomal protein S16
MAVVIRLKRTGRRNRPCYRISVADKAKPRDGRTLDNLGVYDPASPKPELRLTLHAERAKVWLERGALPSDTVRSIFKREGVYADDPRATPKKRKGRSASTAKKARRAVAKTTRGERKVVRHDARVAEKRATAKAAAADSE